MKNLGIALCALSIAAAVACIVFINLAIWTDDDRWADTAFVPGLVATGTLFAGVMILDELKRNAKDTP